MSKADILIVEDDLITATVVKKYLERSNYNVLKIVDNGDEAIKMGFKPCEICNP